MPLFPRLSRTAVIALFACIAALSQPVWGDSLQDADRLLRQGQRTQALDKVDQYLAGKPKDAQGRFLKGVILSELNRQQEAIAVFTKLTEDYPELPEPYNNLAVIYAQQKQYDKAKQALEMAIRTHPSYATAHENLGDIYARLASQAYDKALQLDSSNTSAQFKLSMIRDLISGTPGAPGSAKPIAATGAANRSAVPRRESKVDEKPAEPAKAATEGAPTEPAHPVAETLPVKPAEAVATIAEGKPAEAGAKPAATEPATASDAVSQVPKAVGAWVAAWSKKDIKAYLAFYAADFAPPGGEERSAWEAERTRRIAKPGSIQVSYEKLRVTSQGSDRAVAKFRQHYRSRSLKTSSNKILVFVRRDGKWLIQQERVGD